MASGLRRIHGLVVVCCLLGSSALGQQAGQIVGVVTDSSGGVVPGITIKATSAGRIQQRRCQCTAVESPSERDETTGSVLRSVPRANRL